MKLEPAFSIIQRLGGFTAVANATGAHYTTVWKWTRSKSQSGTGGLIPIQYHVAILDLARSLDVPLTAAAFLPVHPEQTKRRKREAA